MQAVEKAFHDIHLYHGQPQGMYGGDEPMHGTDPTQGIELCSVVELMYSLEKMIAISGNLSMMDHLEKIAYNALPTQVTDDFSARQYFQQANQVMLTRERHNFYEEDHHGHTDLCYGLLTGYPCCTCNLHQGWPKLVSHMWYATNEGGLAAVVYGPCKIKAKVRGGVEVSIREETTYPFEDKIRFQISTNQETSFPLLLKIPGWCSEPSIQLNGQEVDIHLKEGMAVLKQTWKEGDLVELHLPMQVTLNRWVENSVSVERGPLVYSLSPGEDWSYVENSDKYGDFSEVRPLGPWNYGLLEAAVLDPDQGFELIRKAKMSGYYPWTEETAPLALITKGKQIPDWKLYRAMAGALPHSLPLKHLQGEEPEVIKLIPYGCTTLRITEFPVVR
jgi:hypothetical protein